MILYDSTNVLYMIMLLDDFGDIKDAFKKFSDKNKDSIKGKISGFAGSLVGKVAMGAAITYAMNEAIQWASDKWDLSYDSGMKNTQNSVSEVQKLSSEIDSLTDKQENYKKSLIDIGSKYNLDLSDLNSVDEMISKINKQSGIKLIDQAEIEKIQKANTSLQSSLTLKENSMTSKERKSAEHAEKTLTLGKQSFAEKIKARINKKDKKGGIPEWAVGNADITTQVEDDINLINEYTKDVEDYKKNNKKKKVKEYSKYINELKDDLSTRQQDLSTLLSAFSKGGQGEKALVGYEEEFNKVKQSLEDIVNMDLTPSQRALKNLSSYFDGSVGKNAIKKELQDAYKAGSNLGDELNKMGITLDDLGIDNVEQLSSYFREVASSSKEAKKTVQDYSASVSDVNKATESTNEDSDWTTIQQAYSSAKDLLKEGKTGTDDFQSMAKFLNPKDVKKYAEKNGKYDADAYQKAFEKAQKTANRWFGKDETTSMNNFVEDFKKKNLMDVKTDKDGLLDITSNFKTTAEAADKFGISVNAVETMLHGLEAYGYDFSKITFSTDGLTQYKTALDGIESIYKDLDNSDAKTRLSDLLYGKDVDGKHVKGWKEEYNKYKDDLDSLSKEQIVKIKFEYDLATIQQKINELQGKADEGGDSQTWAELNAEKRQYREKSESRKGNKLTKDSAYNDTSDTIEALRSKLNSTSNENQKQKIQEQISSLYDAQNKINDMFADSGLKWDEFIDTPQYKSALSDLVSFSEEARKEVADILGVDLDDIKVDVDDTDAKKKLDTLTSDDGKVIQMKVDASTTEINQALNSLETGQTLMFRGDVDGVEQDLAAVKNEDGTISYIGEDGGVQVYLQEVKHEDGTVTYTVGKYPKKVPKAKSQADYHVGKAPKNVPDASGKANYSGNFPKKAPTITGIAKYTIKKVGSLITSGGEKTHEMGGRGGGGVGGFNGTAHVYGTAKANGDWSVKKSGPALVGELGREILRQCIVICM